GAGPSSGSGHDLPLVTPDTARPTGYVPDSGAPSPTARPSDPASSANEIVSDLLSRMGLSDVLSAQIAANPSDGRTGPWFYATVSCPDASNGQCMHAVWEADLLQGATAELMNWSGASNLANVLVGSSITAR